MSAPEPTVEAAIARAKCEMARLVLEAEVAATEGDEEAIEFLSWLRAQRGERTAA